MGNPPDRFAASFTRRKLISIFEIQNRRMATARSPVKSGQVADIAGQS